MIEIDVFKRFSEQEFHLKAQLPSSGITAVFGQSGAGKTTLINLLSGLVTPDGGSIKVDDRFVYDHDSGINVPVEKRNIGYVFQDARLFPHMKVAANLRYGVTQFDAEHFAQICQLLSINHLLNRYPSRLSGGEKQRVAIGRALLSKPDILLMDEPLSSLDIERKRELMPFIEKLSHSISIPVVYVTHSLNEILRLANHLVIIDSGKVTECGDIETVWASRTMSSWQSFSDRSMLFRGKITEQNERYGLTKVMLNRDHYLWVQHINGQANDDVRLRVRASDVSLVLERPKNTSIRNVLNSQIMAIHYGKKGAKQSAEVVLDLGENCHLLATVTLWAIDELQLQVGQRVYAQIKGVSVSQKDIALEYH
ncbi:molybdenum ABC transporter ATP-binding protein ModC [Vibrio hippocampi]|uniref:Molybdenum import ATP-binding protein ModC n=1 Tax=Vibrio hippocampi TaxID=654686 RepID=A0ABN8DMG3_9VIBR|nr:molybdenum ABC transporter ATP-binding protein ModC [Vibrio hippocampi]CAH0529614.1 Molybdenum import ATP-binding protein ModC [Vibrio hippocampi]